MIIKLEFSKFYSNLKERFLTKDEFHEMINEEILMCIQEKECATNLSNIKNSNGNACS